VNIGVDPIEVALQVTSALDRLGVLHTIGGSIASSIAGEPRSTIDVDIVAALRDEHVAELTRQLSADFYVDEDAVRRAVATASAVNVIHHETSIKIDLFVAGGTPLDAQQLARRVRVDVGGRIIYVHPPEDILLQKLRWFRLSGETSERQWRDAVAIVRVQGDRLDRLYVRQNAESVGVVDLVEKIL
jgi:hypothetical protein